MLQIVIPSKIIVSMKFVLTLLFLLSSPFLFAQDWQTSQAPADIEQMAVHGERLWLIGSTQEHGRGIYRKKGDWEFLKGIDPVQVAISEKQAAVIGTNKVTWHYTGVQWVELSDMNQSSAIAFQKETLWIIDNGDTYQLKDGEWTQNQVFSNEVKMLIGSASSNDMAYIEEKKGSVWVYQGAKETALNLPAVSVAVGDENIWAVNGNNSLQVLADEKWQVVVMPTPVQQVAYSSVGGKGRLWVLTDEGAVMTKTLPDGEWEVFAEPATAVGKIVPTEVNEKDKQGNTALLRAVRDKDMTEAAKLLEQTGVDVNIVNKDKESALLLALGNGDIDFAIKLLEAGADVSLADKEGANPLMLVIAQKQTEIFPLILEKSIDLNASNKKGETALMLAINTKQEDLAKALIAAGAGVNEHDKQGQTALMMAVQTQQQDLVGALIDAGATLDELDKEKRSAIGIASNIGNEPLVKLLLEKGADVSKGSPLIVAVSNQDSSMVNILLDANADPSSALLEAAQQNNTSLFQKLIERGGELSNNDPLEKAIEMGNLEISQICLTHGGNANKGLDWAIEKNNRPIVIACLDNGAKANPVLPYAVAQADQPLFTEAITKYEANAQQGLAAAMEANKTDFAKIALDNGADPNRPLKEMIEADNATNTEFLLKSGADANKALNYAVDANNVKMATLAFKYEAVVTSNFLLDTSVKNKNLELATLLVSKGADPNKSLMLAIKDAEKEIVAMLLEKGADASEKKLIREACEQGNVEITQLLLQKGAIASEGMKPAVKNNHTQVVELLLVSGAKAIDPYYIETAASLGNMDMAQMLLDKGAVPDAGMSNAIEGGHTEMVEMLLSAGASAVKESYMVMAVGKGYYKIVKMLIKGNCPVSYTNQDAQSLLHISCISGSAPIAGLLLEKQLDVNKKDIDGNTPLHYAVQNKDGIELVQLLTQQGADVNAKNTKGNLVYKEAKGGDIRRLLKSLGALKK